MSTSTDRPAPPAQLTRVRAALAALGATLACVDPLAWNSLARPQPGDLAQLMFSLQGEIASGLEALGYPPTDL